MPRWELSFTPAAENDFKKLDKKTRKRIYEKLERLSANFNEVEPLPLTGSWRGFFKLRVGDWRVIYRTQSEKLAIIVYVIDRRDKVYKVYKRKP